MEVKIFSRSKFYLIVNRDVFQKLGEVFYTFVLANFEIIDFPKRIFHLSRKKELLTPEDDVR